MANADKNFDQYFKEKLVNHEVRPSKLAWEKLDSQLGNKKRAIYFPFMRIAAAIILLLGVGYIIWQVSRTEELSGPQTAEVIELTGSEESLEMNTQAQVEIETNKEEEVKPLTPESPIPEKTQQASPAKPQGIKNTVTESPKELLADNTIQAERTQEEMVSIPEFELPELKMTEAIAMNTLEEEEVVEYKITIKSKGLKEEPQKLGLIGGIEEKVDKIGGFLNKVEQGFADLQDAKENLFASNVPRRERSK